MVCKRCYRETGPLRDGMMIALHRVIQCVELLDAFEPKFSIESPMLKYPTMSSRSHVCPDGTDHTIRTRRGFTLVELLVVIAIIGVMVGLLLPAVQSAREAARRMSCSNNMKQIGLALHNYHSAFKSFPASGRPENYTANGWARKSSWFIAILPQLEQSAIYDGIDFSASSFDNMNAGWAAPVVHWEEMNRARVPGFWCPSSVLAKTNIYPTNDATQALGAPENLEVQIPDYAGNSGCNFTGGTIDDHPTAVWDWGGVHADNGFFGMKMRFDTPWPGTETRFASLLDGTSHTIAVGEQGGVHGTFNDHRAGAALGGMWSCGTATAGNAKNNYVVTRYPINYSGDDWPSWGGLRWNGGWEKNGMDTAFNNTAFRSQHIGGAQFVMADGSVQFITDSIQFEIYTALMDRADRSAMEGLE